MLAIGGLTPAEALQHLQHKPTWQRPPVTGLAAGQRLALVLLGTNAYDKESYRQIVELLSQESWQVRPITCPPRIAQADRPYSVAHANRQL